MSEKKLVYAQKFGYLESKDKMQAAKFTYQDELYREIFAAPNINEMVKHYLGPQNEKNRKEFFLKKNLFEIESETSDNVLNVLKIDERGLHNLVLDHIKGQLASKFKIDSGIKLILLGIHNFWREFGPMCVLVGIKPNMDSIATLSKEFGWHLNQDLCEFFKENPWMKERQELNKFIKYDGEGEARVDENMIINLGINGLAFVSNIIYRVTQSVWYEEKKAEYSRKTFKKDKPEVVEKKIEVGSNVVIEENKTGFNPQRIKGLEEQRNQKRPMVIEQVKKILENVKIKKFNKGAVYESSIKSSFDLIILGVHNFKKEIGIENLGIILGRTLRQNVTVKDLLEIGDILGYSKENLKNEIKEYMHQNPNLADKLESSIGWKSKLYNMNNDDFIEFTKRVHRLITTKIIGKSRWSEMINSGITKRRERDSDVCKQELIQALEIKGVDNGLELLLLGSHYMQDVFGKGKIGNILLESVGVGSRIVIKDVIKLSDKLGFDLQDDIQKFLVKRPDIRDRVGSSTDWAMFWEEKDLTSDLSLKILDKLFRIIRKDRKNEN